VWASADDLRESLRYEPRADEAIAAASQILWSLSGRKFSGTRNVTEFYDVRHGLGWVDRYHFLQQQALFQVENRNVVICSNCGYPHRMRLRHQPVQRILSVEINGQTVPASDYALLNHATLGLPFNQIACIAMCARVTYIYGVNPPAGGRAAAVKLAEQLLFSWTASDECRLPQRITNVTRQGISWTILDPQDFLNDGRTGIFEIDLFLKSVNPDHARRPARVFSPDLPRAQTVTQELPPPNIAVGPNDLGVVSAGDPAWHVSPAAGWPLTAFTPYATINGVVFDAEHFTQNGDLSQTFMLASGETLTLVEGDLFVVGYHQTGNPDTVVSTGYVRFVQA
jgi:hypothetical protein